MRVKFFTLTCVYSTIFSLCVYISVTTLLHFPSNQKFSLSILWVVSKITCVLCWFVHAMHICLYSMDSRLCSCHELLPLTSRSTFVHLRSLHGCTFCSCSRDPCPCIYNSTISQTTISSDTTC
jgi:hypothetical protein